MVCFEDQPKEASTNHFHLFNIPQRVIAPQSATRNSHYPAHPPMNAERLIVRILMTKPPDRIYSPPLRLTQL